ncbi:hypothetical protein CLU79DRAFT_752783 [Phycomyces nitens]|nr:hypothetical protein CLU79DRAFT_752783 [Phycomyces nitens]
MQQRHQKLIQDIINGPNVIDNSHPIVPSQRVMDLSKQPPLQQVNQPTHAEQRSFEAQQEAVAAAAQQVMAQQMAIIQQQASSQQSSPLSQNVESLSSNQTTPQPTNATPNSNTLVDQLMSGVDPMNMSMAQAALASHDTPHVVMSQLSTIAASAGLLQQNSTGHSIATTSISALENALSQQQQQQLKFINENTENQIPKRAVHEEPQGSSSRKKVRRHTVSSTLPPHLNIRTQGLSIQNNFPHSAVVSHESEHPYRVTSTSSTPSAREPCSIPPSMFADDQKVLMIRRLAKEHPKHALGHISLPPPPTPAELGLKVQPKKEQTTESSNTSENSAAKEFDSMSREELIARLIELEREKKRTDSTNTNSPDVEILGDNPDARRGSAVNVTPAASIIQVAGSTHHDSKSETTMEDEDEEPGTPLDSQNKDEEKSEDADELDEDEDEEDAEVDMLEGTEPEKLEFQCLWRDCGETFEELQKLITHINDNHVGSGKPTYCCEWEKCIRNQKPFTKRHKMYNHLRTHTGERPFVCTKQGCEKRFSRPDSLTTHIKTHSNVRPYLCSYHDCSKAYYHSRSLKKHEKTHEVTGIQQLTPAYQNAYNIPTGQVPVDYMNNHMAMHQQNQIHQVHHQHQVSSIITHPHPLPLPPQPHGQPPLGLPHHPYPLQSPHAGLSSPHAHPFVQHYISPTHMKSYPTNSMPQYSPSGMVESPAGTPQGVIPHGYDPSHQNGYQFRNA